MKVALHLKHVSVSVFKLKSKLLGPRLKACENPFSCRVMVGYVWNLDIGFSNPRKIHRGQSDVKNMVAKNPFLLAFSGVSLGGNLCRHFWCRV